jgi:Cft2 family RNA processing exonuclease
MPTTLRPLLGSGQSGEPLCYLLQVDEARILLDCGCFEDGSEDTPAAAALTKLQDDYMDALTESVHG